MFERVEAGCGGLAGSGGERSWLTWQVPVAGGAAPPSLSLV